MSSTQILHHHFKIHKPYGFLSQFVGEKASQKKLGQLYPFPEGTMAIGRLDQDSEGLLLLTTNGLESEYIRSRKVEKEYWVQVDGSVSETALEKLRMGVDIILENQTYTTLPCRVEKLEPAPEVSPRSKKVRDDRHGPTSWITITLTEGKFRQVRKMTAAVGFPTLRLIRVRIGPFLLGDLKSGEVEETGPFSEGLVS
jgi:23S rRNA pseudouridine2457 synthase